MNKKFGTKMSQKKHDFPHKKVKKSPMNPNQPDFIRIEKKPGFNSEFDSNSLQSLFNKLNPKKKSASKLSQEEKLGFKKSHKPKKDYSSELTDISSVTIEEEVPKRKRKLQEVDEDPSPKVPRIVQKVSKEEDSSLETVSEATLERANLKESKKKKKKSKKEQHDINSENDRLLRTLFVGNLPMNITRKDLERLFSTFGSLDSVRLRGVIPMKAHMPRKVAEIKRAFHSSLQSRKGFVVFKNAEEAENAALALNGKVIGEHHIVVDRASAAGEKRIYDDKRTIFVGNLPFGIEDEEMWNSFSQFGDVEAVRVIRDKTTGSGKGFGYVLFRNTDAKKAALSKETIEIEERKIRIKDVEGQKKQNSSSQNYAMRGRALNMKRKRENVNSRKSLKKIMKKEKFRSEKKKMANVFKNFF